MDPFYAHSGPGTALIGQQSRQNLVLLLEPRPGSVVGALRSTVAAAYRTQYRRLNYPKFAPSAYQSRQPIAPWCSGFLVLINQWRSDAAVERMWHMSDSQGQMLALTFRSKLWNDLKLFPLRSKAGVRTELKTLFDRNQPGHKEAFTDRSRSGK